MIPKSFTVAVLLHSAEAVKLNFRPPTNGQAPWHDPFVGSKVEEKEPYFVPNFGIDQDVIHTQKHLEEQEKAKGAWNPQQDKDGKWVVPEVFNDVMKKGTPTEIAVGPIGYKNMAQLDEQNENEFRPPSLKAAPWKKPDIGQKEAEVVPYFVPNFGVDHDIKAVQKHLSDQEASKGAWTPKQNGDGRWVVPEVYNDVFKPETSTPTEIAVGPIGYKNMAQLEEQNHHRGGHRGRSDPVCGSSGCSIPNKLAKHRKSLPDYPDPDAMSLDGDIVDSQENEKKVFADMESTWNVESGEDIEEAYQTERDGSVWGGYEAGNAGMWLATGNRGIGGRITSAIPKLLHHKFAEQPRRAARRHHKHKHHKQSHHHQKHNRD